MTRRLWARPIAVGHCYDDDRRESVGHEREEVYGDARVETHAERRIAGPKRAVKPANRKRLQVQVKKTQGDPDNGSHNEGCILDRALTG